MFPYRVKYNESESDIQKYQFIVQNRPKTPKYFRTFGKVGKTEKLQKNHFVYFCKFWITNILYRYEYT